MVRRGFLFLALTVAATLFPPGIAAAKGVLVFAAASTTNALEEVNRLFEARGGGRAVASFASTGILARQIEHGAPADLILSANVMWMDYLAGRGFLVDGTRGDLFGNRLALIAPADSTLDIEIAPGFALAQRIDGGRLAIADPGHTPAGMYAKRALTALGVWPALARRTARANSVREALVLVERGEAPAGIVYATDAKISRKVRIVSLFPVTSHSPIRYQAAIVAGRDTAAARRYRAFLESTAAVAVFRKHGFLVD